MTEFEMLKRHFKISAVIYGVLGSVSLIFASFFSSRIVDFFTTPSGFLFIMAVGLVAVSSLLYLLHVSVKKNPFNQLARAERSKLLRKYRLKAWAVVPFLLLLPALFLITLKLGLSFYVSMWTALGVFMLTVSFFTYGYTVKMTPKLS